jgi:heptaprenyl diphosphate synthase
VTAVSTDYEIDILSNRSNKLRLGYSHIIHVFERIQNLLLVDDLVRFNHHLQQALAPQLDYLTETELQLYKRGKKLRPMMMLLSAKMVWGDEPLPEKVIIGAVSLEMLHVASLIHDDIIDGALMRRGIKSVNATRGTNTAILVGDLQFLQAIRSFVGVIDTDSEMDLVKTVLDTTFGIICGQLDELTIEPDWTPQKLRAHYYQVIERKTAILFGQGCQSGIALAGGRSRDVRRIGSYGRSMGRAFQIMDDLLDNLLDSNTAGKTQGTDLAQQRFSLPIIYAMQELGDDHLVSQIIRGQISPTTEQLAQGIEAVTLSDGFAKAYADARFEALDALEYLKPFENNKYRAALEEIALATVDRNY